MVDHGRPRSTRPGAPLVAAGWIVVVAAAATAAVAAAVGSDHWFVTTIVYTSSVFRFCAIRVGPHNNEARLFRSSRGERFAVGS